MSRLFSSIFVRIAIIGVIALGAFILRDRFSSTAGDLAVGDCFDIPTGTTVKDVQHHPCSEAHDGEILFVGNHPAANGTTFPTDSEFTTWAAANCLPAFTGYTGKAFESVDTMDIGFFTPTPDGWTKSNDRKIMCYIAPLPAGTKVTTSFKASK